MFSAYQVNKWHIWVSSKLKRLVFRLYEGVLQKVCQAFCYYMLLMKDYSQEEQLNNQINHSNALRNPHHQKNTFFLLPLLTISTIASNFTNKLIFALFLCFLVGSLNFIFIKVNWKPHSSSHFDPLYLDQNQNTQSASLLVDPTQPSLIGRFPKVFWIYTQNEFGTQSMNQQIYLQLFNETAVKAGFEVKFANSWNSYDWLSAETIAKITKTMHKSRVDEGIHNLLKFALLMQNGGILVNQIDIVILGDKLDWLQQMFEYQGDDYHRKFNCDPKSSFVFMSRVPKKEGELKYFDNLLAALPGSLLFREAFETLSQFITTGSLSCPSDIIKINSDTKVRFLINSFEQIINCLVEKYRISVVSQEQSLCQKYGIQETKIQNYVNYAELNYNQKKRLLLATDPETIFPRTFNLPAVNYVRGLNSGPIIDILNSLLRSELQNSKQQIEEVRPGSIAYKIINASGNRQIFVDPMPKRQINFCIVVINEVQDEEQWDKAERLAKMQSYQRWKQVVFAQDMKRINFKNDTKITVLQSTHNQIRNIEIAVTKHCQPTGYAVLLHSNDKFSNFNFLTDLAKLVHPRDTLGAFLHLEHSGRFIQAKQQWSHFHRGSEAIVNPKMHKLNSILNHMRVFAIQSFRYIPQFDLRDIHGKYFQDRLIFLMTLLELIRSKIHQPRMLYLMKKYSSVWNVPRKMVILQSGTIRVKQMEKVDQRQLQQTRARLQCQQVFESMKNILKWKIPFSKMLAFNQGDDFLPAEHKKGPELIPKVIHQVWLGTNKLPPAKEYFLRKTKMLYPHYTVKLWREENITRQNFPLTYQLIINLLNFSKNSPYNKLATVTDIMRHEILAIEGGFWKDAGMNLLRPIFDKFTRYKLVIPVDKTFRYRWLQGMCFFANKPGLENMLRINNYRNLNRMRIYDNYASSIAGPIDFRQLLVGQEEYDVDVLTMPYETFYPAQVAEHPLKDLCTKRWQQLQEGDGVEIVQNGWYLLSGCEKLYPFSFAVEHNRFGDSWAKRRAV